MRIAHITDVKDGLAGGIERHVFELAVNQKKRGDSPVVVAPEPGGLTASCEEYGIPVTIEARPAGQPAAIIDDLCALFKDLGAEVIHCHTPNSAAKALAVGNRMGIPCVYTLHVDKGLIIPNLGNEFKVPDRYSEFKFPNLEFAVIAVSRRLFERLKYQGFPEESLYHIPNGTKVVPRGAGGSPRPGLISVGRLDFIKGFDIAILAMAVLQRRYGSDCPPLNVYGIGAMEEQLKEMVSILSLDNTVRFHGVQLGILERCPASDILIVSSRMEAGPLVAVEAMSRGMPIVATRVGEIEEMIPDQRYGYIVRTGSILALADGIESMLSDVRAGRFDPELPISRHRALYALDILVERVDAVYKRLTTRNASAR
jgi:glycosyltransferase involved in cell wall biosynthesis